MLDGRPQLAYFMGWFLPLNLVLSTEFGRLAQRQSIGLTHRGPQVQILYRPPIESITYSRFLLRDLVTLTMSLPDFSDLVTAVRPSIVAFVNGFVPEGEAHPAFPRIIGTGFFVDKRGIALTCGHVINKLKTLPRRGQMAMVFSEIELTDGGRQIMVMARPIRAYSDLHEFEANGPFYGEKIPDFGFVQIEIRDVPLLQIAADCEAIRIGNDVAFLGFSSVSEALCSYGTVVQVTPFLRRAIISSVYPFPSPNPHGFTMDAGTSGGESGSPVFVPGSATVVGMVFEGFEGITVALPAKLLHDAVAEALEDSLDLTGVPTFGSIVNSSKRADQVVWESIRPRSS